MSAQIQARSLLLETYVATVRQSVGSRAFRSYFVKSGNKKSDSMRKGDLSCAFFVSGILTMFGLIKKLHGTVDGTVADLKNSGWKKIRTPKIGCVLVWQGKLDERGEMHKHIGFYVGNKKAISNSSKKRSPAVHHWTFAPRGKKFRAIEAMYWLPSLQ